MVKLIFEADFKSGLRIVFFRWKSWEKSLLSLKNRLIHPKFKDEFFSRGGLRWKKKLRIDSESAYSEVYGEFFRFLLSWVLLSNVRSSICGYIGQWRTNSGVFRGADSEFGVENWFFIIKNRSRRYTRAENPIFWPFWTVFRFLMVNRSMKNGF